VSDLQMVPVDELLVIAARYGIHVRLIESDRIEVRPSAGTTPIERVVAARLRARAREIAAVLVVRIHTRPQREAA